ncbi:hypothetical protein RJ639_016533 [Escallonia herrerae]|uniref:Ribulose bisphosphate carboxylase small subunit domain-containing protein n=1 Tax=Escallonia herrerae TaxID=1293975 RepID=A0AA89AJF9_9ASTE|nr:hypothetical protein RJ639_016533 [Escallonia herrerae]
MSVASFLASVTGSSYFGLRPQSSKLFQMKDSVAWTQETVSNGSKTRSMNVVLGIHSTTKNLSLSYLPPLTDESMVKEIDYMIKKGWTPCFEFDAVGTISEDLNLNSLAISMEGWVRVHGNSQIPNYYDGRYWTLWKLPMFACNDPSQVLHEIQECKKTYPNAHIRCLAFDNLKQAQCMSLVIQKPIIC